MTATLTRTDIETTLEDYVERCREELERAEYALRVYRHGPGPNQPRLDDQPPKKKTRAKSKKPRSGGGSETVRRKWTDEEKADLVARAAEIGTASAAEEAGVNRQMIDRWRREGFGSAA